MIVAEKSGWMFAGVTSTSNSGFAKTKVVIVKKGDTLLGIAQKYFKNGFKWTELRTLESRKDNNYTLYFEDEQDEKILNPKLLQEGTQLEMDIRNFPTYQDYELFQGGYLIDTAKDELIYVITKREVIPEYPGYENGILAEKAIIMKGDNVFAGPYFRVNNLRLAPDKKTITYYATDLKPDQTGPDDHYHYYFNNKKYDHEIIGNSPQFYIFNKTGTHYYMKDANIYDRHDYINDQFKYSIEADFGNSPYYDSIDDFGWLDDENHLFIAYDNNKTHIYINNGVLVEKNKNEIRNIRYDHKNNRILFEEYKKKNWFQKIFNKNEWHEEFMQLNIQNNYIKDLEGNYLRQYDGSYYTIRNGIQKIILKGIEVNWLTYECSKNALELEVYSFCKQKKYSIDYEFPNKKYYLIYSNIWSMKSSVVEIYDIENNFVHSLEGIDFEQIDNYINVSILDDNRIKIEIENSDVIFESINADKPWVVK